MPLQVARTTHSIVVVDSHETVEHAAVVECDRDQLLSDYDSWGAARAYLQGLPREFGLLPLLHDFTSSIERIERATLEAEAIAIWEYGRAMLRILEEACDESHQAAKGHLAVIVDKASGPDGTRKYSMSLREPDVDVLARFDLVERLERPDGWRINYHRLNAPHPPRPA